MNAARLTLLLTLLAVAALAVWLTVARWDAGDRLATAVSAVAGVAAVGVAVWTALRPAPASRSWTVRRSGRATSSGGTATTGIRVVGDQPVNATVDRTGDATATGAGRATTGIDGDR